LANTAPSESAPPVAPSASAPQVVPSAPQIAVAEPVAPVRSKTLPSDPQPTARDAANTSVVMTADARAATIAGPAAAGLAMTSLAAVEEPKVRPRAERRRRAIHSSHSFGLFGFRIVGGAILRADRLCGVCAHKPRPNVQPKSRGRGYIV
jgi:hypothetical protein